MKYDIALINKVELISGDTILCKDNKIRTVCENNITVGFMGLCIFGDSYKLGIEKVKKVINSQY